MNLKELIKEVERLREDCFYNRDSRKVNAQHILCIKQTVEAINNMKMYNQFGVKTSHYESKGEFEDWLKLKRLLDIK